ncbi:hypothetical protein [Amycolatopsis sp. FDAARGOS 1241]|uniref:hypothetical protein n=1 Tax=Amycolatopsis sp. FDAARGOS 1241 TaxID=2778070 RepID=UPI00194E7295|nr:hypothetical protein [Amycolatopsis sp. FDAARGOS 1241]QRP44234.1 hypothetical protein I6J71_33825 [Amycolatopsis sp. FDAARGOS 1241]
MRSYTLLGIPHDACGIAIDPDQTVPLHRMAELMIGLSDGAAADYLRARLGDSALRATAARAGSFDRMFSGETLLLLFPEFCPPSGAPAAVRRAAGDRLSDRFGHDEAFRAQVVPRVAARPPTVDDSSSGPPAPAAARPRTWPPCTMKSLPRKGNPPTWPGSSWATSTPGTSRRRGGDAVQERQLPRNPHARHRRLWPDRRPGTAVLLIATPSVDLANAAALLDLCVGSPTTPATFAEVSRALGH